MPIETTAIYPTQKHNRPRPPAKIALHGFDLLSPPIQIHNHRFYRRPSVGASASELIDKLKTSLAEALELYPAVAGTVLTSDEDGETYIATDMVPGTPFLVDVRDTAFSGDSEDLSPRSEQILAPGSSSFAVKATQFSCGTIAVASSLHHQVADLRGFLDFLEVWAQLARGERVSESRLPDDWSRTPGRFFAGLGRGKDRDAPPPFAVLDTPARGAPAYLLVPSQVTRWRLSGEALARLKHDFSPAGGDAWISSGDALSALLSGAVARARQQGQVPRLEGRSSEASGVEKIAMAADGRERCAPGSAMAGGKYFGNFNNLWSATVARSDLLSPTHQAGARVALALRNGLHAALAPHAIADRIAFFEDPRNTTPAGRITWAADIILTNWCRFDLKGPTFDVGWGRPFMTTDGSGSVFPPGYSVMTQNKDTGDTVILLTVEHDAAQALQADPLLNEYAAPLA